MSVDLKQVLDFPAAEYQEGLAEEKKAAEEAGQSVRAQRLWQAAMGVGNGSIDYGPTVKSLVEVAEHFGVSERWVNNWRARGMPGETGAYNLAAIRLWLRMQRDGQDQRLETGNPDLLPRDATGDLVRAMYRVLRFHLPRAILLAMSDVRRVSIAGATDAARATSERAYLLALSSRLDEFILTDEEIEAILKECWPLV